VNVFEAMALPWRLAAMFIAGLVLGSVANAGIYRLGYRPRLLSPWLPGHPRDERSCWLDRLPVWGWIRLRRQAAWHGRGWWLRPLAVEIFCGLAVAGLYWWHVVQLGPVAQLLPPGVPPRVVLRELMYPVFGVQVVLVLFMIMAAFIDLDEMVIPDSVTVWGALAGLLLACLLPGGQLPDRVQLLANTGPGVLRQQVVSLHFRSPQPWLAEYDGPLGLGLGLGCYAAWCLALLPRLWRPSRGLGRAVRMFFAYMVRSGELPRIGLLLACGAGAIAAVWSVGGAHWQGLLSGLVGMAGGGALVWGVRVVVTWALHREAMGFGDVTLMAMVGAYLGWQAAWLAFLLSPFAAVLPSLLRLLLRGSREMPYGPYLCLSSLAVCLLWGVLWRYTLPMFGLGWIMPAFIAASLLLTAAVLRVWRSLRERGGAHEEA
jgi:prepilin signal peptidase PulO-like enzyme (type II secretory pathway)